MNFGIIIDIVNLIHINVNELKDEYGKYSDNYYDIENKNLVSIDKITAYKKIKATTRKRTIARKRGMSSSALNLSIDCSNDVVITMGTANEVTNHNLVIYEVTSLKL